MAFSMEGFLDHTQNLASVIAKDSATIQKLGITHKQIGDRLESLMGKANRQLQLKRRLPDENDSEVEEEQVTVEEVFLITVVGWMGIQQCPFFYEKVKDEESIGTRVYSCGNTSQDFTIFNKRNNQGISFSGLMAHLVRDHHFFEGNTSYRLNPERVIQVLELEPGVDYTPVINSETVWRKGNFTGKVHEDFCGSETFIKNTQIQHRINRDTIIYLNGDKGLIVAKKTSILEEPLYLDGNFVSLWGNQISRGQQFIHRIQRRFIGD
jgi:hypothetical protein